MLLPPENALCPPSPQALKSLGPQGDRLEDACLPKQSSDRLDDDSPTGQADCGFPGDWSRELGGRARWRASRDQVHDGV